MFELFAYGEKFLSMVNTVGDWLLSTPPFIEVPLIIAGEVVDYIRYPWPFGSIASFIFGGGILFLLGFRLVKWLLDIVL